MSRVPSVSASKKEAHHADNEVYSCRSIAKKHFDDTFWPILAHIYIISTYLFLPDHALTGSKIIDQILI